MLLLKELQVGHLVTTQIAHDVLATQKIRQLACLLLIVVQLLQDLLALLVELCRRLRETVDFLLQVTDEIRHVGGLQQLVLGLRDLERLGVVILGDLASCELQQREDQVSVEVLDQLGEKVVFGHRVAISIVMCVDCLGTMRIPNSIEGRSRFSKSSKCGLPIAKSCEPEVPKFNRLLDHRQSDNGL